MRDHAYRRHHKGRMKAKYFWIQKTVNHWTSYDIHAKTADHLAACSCHGCGNPRHHYKVITRAEYINGWNSYEQVEAFCKPRKLWS